MLITITPATDEPVTLAEAKEHLRVTHAEDDDLIERLITGAREFVEQQTGRALAAASYRYTGTLKLLPLVPAEVTSVEALQSDGVTWEADADVAYDADRNLLTGTTRCQHKVEFTTDPGEVPQALKDAILLRVQAGYEANPMEAEKLRDAAYSMSFPYRLNLGA